MTRRAQIEDAIEKSRVFAAGISWLSIEDAARILTRLGVQVLWERKDSCYIVTGDLSFAYRPDGSLWLRAGLRAYLGEIPRGEVDWAYNAAIAWFAQHRTEVLRAAVNNQPLPKGAPWLH